MSTAIQVSNLPLNVSKTYLYNYFSHFGTIEQLKLNQINAVHCDGNAFIQFSTQEAASRALMLHGTLLQGKRIKAQLMKAPQSIFSPTLYSDVFFRW